ncbi:Thiamine-phosphate synthase, partial [Dysosmobacter welbionis]
DDYHVPADPVPLCGGQHSPSMGYRDGGERLLHLRCGRCLLPQHHQCCSHESDGHDLRCSSDSRHCGCPCGDHRYGDCVHDSGKPQPCQRRSFCVWSQGHHPRERGKIAQSLAGSHSPGVHLCSVQLPADQYYSRSRDYYRSQRDSLLSPIKEARRSQNCQRRCCQRHQFPADDFRHRRLRIRSKLRRSLPVPGGQIAGALHPSLLPADYLRTGV